MKFWVELACKLLVQMSKKAVNAKFKPDASSLSYFERSVVFYKSYHNNETNQLIHMICIPLIAFTGFIFFAYTPEIAISYKEVTLPIIDLTIKLTYGNVIVSIYVIYYLLFEFPGLAGPLAAFLFISGSYYANMLVLQNKEVIWKYALLIHISAWLAQFYGHAVHEKRSPALLDNLVQAFLSAPFFVLLELMFSFGYRKQLQTKIDEYVKMNIEEFKKKK